MLSRITLVFCLAGSLAPAAANDDLAVAYANDVRPLFQSYCFGCHGGAKTKADINLVAMDTLGAALEAIAVLESVADQVHYADMPPEDEAQPTDAERAVITSWIARALAAAEDTVDPGRVTLHRLNRTEYSNTVRDLFDLPADFEAGADFPADGSGGAGFDNNADALFLPPVLMEKYLDATETTLEMVFSGGSPEDARAAVADLLPRAFRRPVSDAEIGRYASLGDARLAFKAILLSPHFLFRYEEDAGEPGEIRTLNDFELASRLSYFLWSSMPDAALFDVARSGTLREANVLGAQIERMLASPKSRALATGFAAQWLGFDDLVTTASPEKGRFPEFNARIRFAMHEEGMAFFEALVRENGSLLRLIDADYTFLDRRLAEYYGIPDVSGDEFQKVSVAGQPGRGGVLGMGGVLTATSFPLRTSPVVRGKWILEELLGTPPPPPPADVGDLPQDDQSTGGVSFRQLLEKHRAPGQCVGCHAKMDPLGFSLENFDPVGRWRTEIGGSPVDARGTLADGSEFTGPDGLKRVLLDRKEQFAKNVTEKLLSYALGRELAYFDRKPVSDITASVLADDLRLHTLVREIAKSYPFQNRKK